MMEGFKEAYELIPQGNGTSINSRERDEDLVALNRICGRTFTSRSGLQFEDYFKLLIVATAGMCLRMPFQSEKSGRNKDREHFLTKE